MYIHVHVYSEPESPLLRLSVLDLDANEQCARLQFLVHRVLERNGTEPGLQAQDREHGLADEVGIPEDVLVLRDEPQQREVGVDDVEVAALVPDRVEAIVDCKAGERFMGVEEKGGGLSCNLI